MNQDGECSMGTQPGTAAGSRMASWPSSPMSSITTIGSDLADLPNLETDESDHGSHLDIASTDCSGHLNLSGISSGSTTPPDSGPAPQVDPVIEEAYSAAERCISSVYWRHASFKFSYTKVKQAMADAGNLDVGRLGSLLGREEEEIRSNLGRTRWQSLNMDHGVDSYATSVITNSRDSTLSWIKSEQRALGLPSKRNWLERLGGWARRAMSRTR